MSASIVVAGGLLNGIGWGLLCLCIWCTILFSLLQDLDVINFSVRVEHILNIAALLLLLRLIITCWTDHRALIVNLLLMRELDRACAVKKLRGPIGALVLELRSGNVRGGLTTRSLVHTHAFLESLSREEY